MTAALVSDAARNPYIALILSLVNLPGWIFSPFEDPPAPPPGFELETKDDGFTGYVTHYRFVPSAPKATEEPVGLVVP